MTPETDTIRRTANGSIDTDHYLRRGAEARSDVAWRAIFATGRALRRLIATPARPAHSTRPTLYPAE